MKKTILVTGGGGFTGRHFIALSKSKGYRVVALTYNRPKVDGADLTLQVNLTDRSQLFRVLAGIKFDFVLHLAAVSFVGHDDIAEIYNTNVVGTINLLDAIANCACPKQVVVASSGNVYGNSDLLPISESNPHLPVNDYAVSKCAMELAISARTDYQPIIVCRPFNYTGVGQAKHFLVPKLVNAFNQKHSQIELGNLDVARDYTDVRDVVKVYIDLLEQDQVSKGVFNICSGKAYSLDKIIRLLSDLTKHQLDIRINQNFVRRNEVKMLYGNNEKLVSLIGDINHYSLTETLEWMLTQPVIEI